MNRNAGRQDLGVGGRRPSWIRGLVWTCAVEGFAFLATFRATASADLWLAAESVPPLARHLVASSGSEDERLPAKNPRQRRRKRMAAEGIDPLFSSDHAAATGVFYSIGY